MKNLRILPLAVCIAFLVSCVTVAFPPKKTSDDCLILIRTTIVNKDNAPSAREFHFKLSSGATITAPHDTEGFMAVMIREPGVKIIRLTSDVNQALATGDSLYEPLDIDLPYKHGEVVVADFIFAQTLEKADERRFLSSFDFQNTSDESKAAVLEQFRKKEEAKSWL
jgi:hypothetical protein